MRRSRTRSRRLGTTRTAAGSLIAAFAAAVALTGLTAGSAGAVEPAPAPQAPTAAPGSALQNSAAVTRKPVQPSFEGTVALSNCSGSVVRMPESDPEDPALVLSNGHCLLEGMPGPGEVVTGRPSDRAFTLLNADGSDAGQVYATELRYATMTDTDVSLYALGSTYEEIEAKYGIEALDVVAKRPGRAKDITVVSGYWREKFDCGVDDFVYRLKEHHWTWKDSLRYTPACQTKGGTSGSPVVDDRTGDVIGVNNTRNESGEYCTLDNPCEVDRKGRVTIRPDVAYGQQVHTLARCVGDGNALALDRRGCTLPKP